MLIIQHLYKITRLCALDNMLCMKDNSLKGFLIYHVLFIVKILCCTAILYFSCCPLFYHLPLYLV